MNAHLGNYLPIMLSNIGDGAPLGRINIIVDEQVAERRLCLLNFHIIFFNIENEIKLFTKTILLL